MPRAVIKLKDGTHINVTANFLDLDKDLILVRDNDMVVAIVKTREVISCHLSEQKYLLKETNKNV